MGENSAIAWTDHTYNPWRGCTKVGPGCDGCYAEARDRLYEHGAHWGPGAPRIRAVEKTRNSPLDIQRKIESGKIEAHRNKVFSLSLGDVFDNEIDRTWRTEYWDVLRRTPKLRHQIVTKRIGNALDMLPDDWEQNFGHCGIMMTAVTQAELDRDTPKLRDVARITSWVGISIEPQIENIGLGDAGNFVDWIISGGESYQPPHLPRVYHLEWALALIFQCKARKIACFVKQLGADPVYQGRRFHVSDHGDMDAWPQDLRVRQFPAALQ